jgi:hypothetical protein
LNCSTIPGGVRQQTEVSEPVVRTLSEQRVSYNRLQNQCGHNANIVLFYANSFTKEEMTRAVTIARKHVEEISAFEWHAWTNMLAPWQNSAAYSYSATTYASLVGQQQGWKGLQSVEASRKLANL